MAAPVISVMLIVPDTPAAVQWYERAFGAQTIWDLGGVAGLQIGGAAFFLHDTTSDDERESNPQHSGLRTARVELFVDDPEAVIAGAAQAGALEVEPVAERTTPWGRHRQGGFLDPFGHRWSVGDRSPLTGTEA